MIHCMECGEKLIVKKHDKDDLVLPYCPVCVEYRYPIYNIAVSMIVIDEKSGQILLIQQYGRPSFILVAGYVNRGESLETAVARGLMEETSLVISKIEYNKSKFFEKSNTLVCNFTVFVNNASEISCNDEIDLYQWFEPDEAIENARPNSLAKAFLTHYFNNRS